MQENQITFSDQMGLILFFAVFAIIGNWAAWQNGYFSFSKQKTVVDITLKDVACIFVLYIGGVFCLQTILFWLASHSFTSYQEKLTTASIMQFCSNVFAVFLVFAYTKTMSIKTVKEIWKTKIESSRSVIYDFFLGIGSWILSFPIVVVVGEITDLILVKIFQYPAHEQVAVRYLKTMLSSPTLLWIAVISILAIAPAIEEFLFRGVLQNWFKKHLGRKAAILLSSLSFALFHYSHSQGASNISLLISLFVFACFLGFVYEKQQSLFASIGLHMMFNLISTLRILINP